MADISLRPARRPAPPELQARAAALIRERGTRGAARTVGVSRDALLAIAAGADVLQGTIVLVAQRLACVSRGAL
jgi:hypothetical protein